MHFKGSCKVELKDEGNVRGAAAKVSSRDYHDRTTTTKIKMLVNDSRSASAMFTLFFFVRQMLVPPSL